MHLEKLSLINFKNYESVEIEPIDGVNCFVGDNGVGKTNLLDSIYYLSLCKSYFNPIDSQNILHNASFFVIQGNFKNDTSKDNIHCGIKRNQKKQFKRNNKQYKRFADHIGLLPIVIITPSDIELINEGSEIRRKFMDSVISQFDHEYLDDLIKYNKALTQRNALLKEFHESNTFDQASLEIWDEQLINLAAKIYKGRRSFIDGFIPTFQEHHNEIVSGSEKVELLYHSHLNDGDMKTMLQDSLQKDRILQRTNIGIHKDDLVFKIGDHSIKKFGSQGQQKSYIVALKLAQFSFINEKKEKKPLLLLDDIYDRLDNSRVKKLMEMIAGDRFGQIFITDTDAERLVRVFEELNVKTKIFIIKEGKIN